jgi:acetate kinase
MGTRSGDLDPGVLGYLMRARGYDAGMIETLIDRASGLLGISGVSGDMRTLKAAAATEPAAALAVDMFRASVAKQLAAMTTVLGGADLIVFTGGIGENDAAGRAAICARLAWSGIHLDAARNATATNPISASSSRCAVRVLPSREDAEIALHAWRLFPQAQRPA